MGFALVAYVLLALTGGWMFYRRSTTQPRLPWLRPLHYTIGGTMVGLVVLLLAIGIVGTLGPLGQLGQSVHLPAGLATVTLTLLSAWSATQIHPSRPWARPVHLSLNAMLFLGFAIVSLTGWDVVQKYLP